MVADDCQLDFVALIPWQVLEAVGESAVLELVTQVCHGLLLLC